MDKNIIITAAVTGSAPTQNKSPHVPITPSEIAKDAIAAAKAGAAIAHIHVRDPATGDATRDIKLYQEVVERIRDSDTDVVINLTTGMGGDLYLGPDLEPTALDKCTDLVGQVERQEHVELLLPEICSLDCGSFNYDVNNYVYVSTTDMLRTGAKRLQKLGVKPELEVFDLGHIWFAKQMIEEGIIDTSPLFQLCMGVKWGAQGTPRNMQTMVDNLPEGANWAAFGIGSNAIPMVAQAALLGGNVRVGLEDNLYLEKGVLATNAQLVDKAANLLEILGFKVQTPEQARSTLGLNKQQGVLKIACAG